MLIYRQRIDYSSKKQKHVKQDYSEISTCTFYGFNILNIVINYSSGLKHLEYQSRQYMLLQLTVFGY